MNPLGTFRNFVNVLREVSFDEVRDSAETPPRVLVLAENAVTARELGTALTGPMGELAIVPREFGAVLGDADRVDVVIVFDPAQTGAVSRTRERLVARGAQLPVLGFAGTGLDDGAALERLRADIVHRLPDRAPAFGRAFPPFRAAAAKAVINGTATANAEFALISNLPAAVPVIGSLAAAGADFIVLTKNQLMMIFKLAAIHGRDLHDHWPIFQEMVPVVGVGLFWRTVAREAASFVPLAAGTIPKVAIAYAGTISTGRAADYYYRTNRKPTRRQVESVYRQATEAVRRLPLPLPGNGAKGREEANPSVEAKRGTAERVPGEAVPPTDEGAGRIGAPPGGERPTGQNAGS